MRYSRRQLLGTTALGFGQLALHSLLSATSEAGLAGPAAGPQTSRLPHLTPHAKRILFLFMKGGPSQVDTFDYKPLLQQHHGQPLPFAKPRVQFAPTNNLLGSPWKFRQYGQCGHWVSDLFPHLARHVDKLCMLHSVYGTNAAHGGASLKLHTG